MTDNRMYRVRFISQDKMFEIYARECFQGDMYGFVVLRDLVFDANTSVVVDPAEEKLKSEFDGVKQTIIPMHSIIRIDEVEKKGTAKVSDLDSNVAKFPSPIYTPNSKE